MFHSASMHYERLGPQARAICDAMELFYRAEIAEALIRGKPGPRSFQKGGKDGEEGNAFDPIGVVMKHLGKIPARARQKLARRLMRENLRTKVSLPARDQEKLKQLVDPESKVPMDERYDVLTEVFGYMAPRKGVGKDPMALVAHFRGLIGQFVPGQMPFNNGRPNEPTPPPEEPPQDDPQPDPRIIEWNPGVYRDLCKVHFEVERITCLDATRGEAGADEIAFAGLFGSSGAELLDADAPLGGSPDLEPDDVSTGPNWATVTPQYDAGQFSDGDQRFYAPREVMNSFDLRGAVLPRYLVTFFAMAETDPRGGFGVYLDDLQGLIETGPGVFASQADLALFSTVVGASLVGGAGVGALVGGPIGALIGLVVGAAYSLVLYLIAYGNQDDIFDLAVGVLEVREDTLYRWPFMGRALSPPLVFQMHGDHGVYEVGYRWRLEMGMQFETIDGGVLRVAE